MVRLVLFDIDGTLVATGGAGLRAFEDVARTRFDRPGAMSRIRFAGRTDVSIVREFFAGNGLPDSPDRIQAFLDDYVFWLDHHLQRLDGRVLAGVRELIDGFRSLPQPPVLGLLTGNIRLGAELKLRRLGLWTEFELGAFGDDHEDRNVLAAIACDRGAHRLEMPLQGREVLVIGDTPLDIACARAVGARCLAVASGGSTLEELHAHAPEWAVPSLAGLDPASLCSGPPSPPSTR